MSFFDHMVTKIKDAFPDAKIGAIFYENNPHNCITNVTHRSLNRGDKFVVSKPEQMVLVGKLDTTLPHVARPAYTVEIQKILDMYSKYTPSEYTSIPSSDSLIIPVYAA